MYFIETDKGFDHGYCWWHNINFAELMQFDTYKEALQRQRELLDSKEVKWAEIRQG
jgi:hypothetical protein